MPDEAAFTPHQKGFGGSLRVENACNSGPHPKGTCSGARGDSARYNHLGEYSCVLNVGCNALCTRCETGTVGLERCPVRPWGRQISDVIVTSTSFRKPKG